MVHLAVRDVFCLYAYVCEDERVRNTLHSAWWMTSSLKVSWLLVARQPTLLVLLEGIGWRRQRNKWVTGSSRGAGNYTEEKEREGEVLSPQAKAALSWEWKKLNITDERTIISNAQTHPSKISLLSSEICRTACFVTTRHSSLSFLYPFPPLPPLLEFPLLSLLNVITKNQTRVKQKQRSMYLQCQLAKHTLQLF